MKGRTRHGIGGGDWLGGLDGWRKDRPSTFKGSAVEYKRLKGAKERESKTWARTK